MATCRVPPLRGVDTLLATSLGEPVALRLRREDLDRAVWLVADADLFRNRALRETDAGPLVLGWLVRSYDRVLFDEYHHGFASSGSLAALVLAWSLRSPWGWAAWQLAAVGLLALGFGAVRFGPPRAGLERRRRSPLEHVRALATALAAAGGHDVVRGLRRRLAPAASPGGGDWSAWVAQLSRTAPNPQAREAAGGLAALARPGRSAADVSRAAHLVEDLWEALHR